MCGIAGITNLSGEIGSSDLRALERMTAAQRHRGPDDSGLYHDSRAALAHRRLSIIDTSPAGRQPISNETGSVWLTYNGEIYNYRELHQELAGRGHLFRSHTDTEVLVHGYEEWGIEGLLHRLRGMFAFALYDSVNRRVLLARDRLGIKPLYYFFDENKLAFASEVKALMQGGLVPKRRDREALAGFLLLGSVPAPMTMYENVRCLLPGQYLVAGPEGMQTRRFWDMNYSPSEGADPEKLAAVLRDAVTRHLVSDVPLGVFLSGGVDSAGLVCLAREAQPRLKTITIAFREREFDEAAQARQIATHFGTEHHEMQVSSADFAAELPKILAAMDQPTNDGVNTYFVAKAAREVGLTVVLSGLGGDELFRGYPHYHWLARNEWPLALFAKTPGAVRRACVYGAVAWGRLRGREAWMRLALLRNGVAAPSLYLAFRGFFPTEQVQGLMGAGNSEMAALVEESVERLRPTANGSRGHADAINYIEVKRYLHDQLLRDTDVFSMAHSVEARVPYLDHEVVELAAALSGSRMMKGPMNKAMLVDAIGDELIAQLARRPKRGFSFPLGNWMRQRTGVLRELALRSDVLERPAVNKMWSAFEQGRLHWSRAWSLVVLGSRA